MKQRVGALLCIVLAAIFAVACGGSGEGSEPGARKKTVLKLASVLPTEHPTVQALEFFRKRVGELSNGEIEIQIFPNSQLGDTTEAIQNVQSGNVQIVMASTAPLASFVPEYNALGMPFIFRDKQHEYKVVDGPIAKQLDAKLEAIGLERLCYFDSGSRNIMTKKGPITKPEDLKGLKIRVMPSKLMTDTIGALGASAVPMGQGEVYSALQTGLLDGWENNPPTALSFKMYETGCRQFAWTRHLDVPDIVMIGSNCSAKLSPEQRAVIDQAAAEATQKQREIWQTSELSAIEELKKNGMVFTEVDTAPFAARVEPLYEQKYAEYGEEFRKICEEIRAVQ